MASTPILELDKWAVRKPETRQIEGEVSKEKRKHEAATWADRPSRNRQAYPGPVISSDDLWEKRAKLRRKGRKRRPFMEAPCRTNQLSRRVSHAIPCDLAGVTSKGSAEAD